MKVNPKDKRVLRELGAQIAEIAALPVLGETIELHKALNGLRPKRPMVMIDQIPWHEMEVEDELTPRCEDDFSRRIETDLRRKLYCWKRMRADMVVEGFVDIPMVVHNSGFGIQRMEETAVFDPSNDVIGHRYLDQLGNEEDLEKIQPPVVRLDREATAKRRAWAEEIFDGVMPVRMRGSYPTFSPWDRLVEWRGPQEAVFDLVMRPDYCHALMRRLTDVHLNMLDQMEREGCLGPCQGLIHCTGAWTDHLASSNPENPKARAKDMWTFAMAQIFSTVSPAMHEEFEIRYAKEWCDRFGLVYYGCCEPLDDRIDKIRLLPNVRKISMSPWVRVERGAEAIGGDYVFSRKPSPAFLARDDWRPNEVEADLRETIDACKRHGCPLELILKDISTVHYEPQRLWQWVDIAMRLVHE